MEPMDFGKIRIINNDGQWDYIYALSRVINLNDNDDHTIIFVLLTNTDVRNKKHQSATWVSMSTDMLYEPQRHVIIAATQGSILNYKFAKAIFGPVLQWQYYDDSSLPWFERRPKV